MIKTQQHSRNNRNISRNVKDKRRQRRSQKRTMSLQSRWETIIRIVHWSRSWYFMPSSYNSAVTINHFLSRVQKVLFSRGIPGAIAFCKHARLVFTQWICTTEGSKENRQWRKKVRKSMGRHVPGKDLKNEELRYNTLRSILTALSTTRGLLYPKDLSVSSIIDPSTRIGEWKYDLSIRRFWSQLGFGKPSREKDLRRAHFDRYHISMKSGPNGKALWYAFADLSVLPQSLVDSIGFVGGDKLHGNMKFLIDNLNWFQNWFPVKGEKFRKVIAIQDLEKSRTIAILDYWSQTALKPIHEFLFSVLKKIPQDVTFHQGSFLEKIQAWDTSIFYSIDLSKATDRFPIDLISEVLSGAFTDEWVSHWKNIMVGFPFDSEKGAITYSVGNPMGAYSSWASFAVAHHFVMFDCCRSLGMEWSKARYVILGDDILIGDTILAEAYRYRIRDLGIEISEPKTFISKDTCEFAKRLIHRGKEITAFPIGSLIDNWKSVDLFTGILIGEERRNLTLESIPDAVFDFFRRNGYSHKAKKRIMDLSRSTELGIRFTSGSISVHDFLWGVTEGNSAFQGNRSTIYSLDGGKIIQKAIVQAFEKSITDPRMNWGEMSMDITLQFLGVEKWDGDLTPLGPEIIPALNVYGQMSEAFWETQSKVKNLEDIEFTKDQRRMFQLPFSEMVFHKSDTEMDYITSGAFSRRVRDILLKELQVHPNWNKKPIRGSDFVIL